MLLNRLIVFFFPPIIGLETFLFQWIAITLASVILRGIKEIISAIIVELGTNGKKTKEKKEEELITRIFIPSGISKRDIQAIGNRAKCYFDRNARFLSRLVGGNPAKWIRSINSFPPPSRVRLIRWIDTNSNSRLSRRRRVHPHRRVHRGASIGRR